MRPGRRRITSAQWWTQVSRTFENELKLFIRKAKQAEGLELREAGADHECGHQFEITVRSALHAGMEGAGPKSHKDYPFFDDIQPNSVVVRAHSLRDALLVAATLTLGEWYKDLLEGPDHDS